MLLDDPQAKKALADMSGEIIRLLVEQYRAELIKVRKVVTRKTYESIAGRDDVTTNKVLIQITANESLFFIISGRRRGAKLPVRKVGDRFELVPDLQEWKVAVGYRGSDYVLARGISERGIEGIPITTMVLDATRDKIRVIVTESLARIFAESVANDIRMSFRQIA